MHPPEESKLIQCAKAGDQSALSDLYERYVDDIYRFLFYRTGDEMVAEDLTATVFTQMITGLPKYEDRGLPFGAWLFRIARSRLADYWRGVERRERRQAQIKQREALKIDMTSHPLEERFDHEGLQQAFEYLTEAEREVVFLRFAGGLSNKEIATVTHSTHNAVKSMMFRALKKLRKILERKASFAREE